MPANFEFSLADLMEDGDDNILAEMSRDRNGGVGPLQTTRSINGDPGRLSIMSMNKILMGYPLYNSTEDALSLQEAAMAHLLTGAVSEPDTELNSKNFQGELLVPDDVLSAAKEQRGRVAKRRAEEAAKKNQSTQTPGSPGNVGAYGGAGNGEAILVVNSPYPIMAPNPFMPYNVNSKVGIPTKFGMIMPAAGVPDEVFTHPAMNGTIQDPNSPAHVGIFVQILANQEGDIYSKASRGLTTDPNPGSFDCSGYIAWATQQLHLGTEHERLNPDGVDIFLEFSLSRDTQWKVCEERGTVIYDLELVKRTKGALIWPEGPSGDFRGHIGVSCGDGVSVLESTGSEGQSNVGRHPWNYQGGVWQWAVGALNPFINYRVFVPYDTSKKPKKQTDLPPGQQPWYVPIGDQPIPPGLNSDLAPARFFGENWGNFVRAILKALNAPETKSNVYSFFIWFSNEQRPDSPNGTYNPLNIQLSDTYQYDYPNFAAGVEAIRNEIDNPKRAYALILEALQKNAGYKEILSAIAHSIWAVARYDPEYTRDQIGPGDPERGTAHLIARYENEIPGRVDEFEQGILVD